MPGQRRPRRRTRFGIAEWYGTSFVEMSAQQRHEYAAAELKEERVQRPCPFRSVNRQTVLCSKEHGVCSIRPYELDEETGIARAVSGPAGGIRTTCPQRFKEGSRIYHWVGEILLGCDDPIVLGEVPFLRVQKGRGDQEKVRDVGSIDAVLVHPDDPANWCALEIQAVYFSGREMSAEFRSLMKDASPGIPFPAKYRRPDYRSSGPKRLMPQLQIKVPTLRRWGKKMAVAVDEHFYDALGTMQERDDLSSADIAWFAVRYGELDGRLKLDRGFVKLTTLEEAVEGLTGGTPVTKAVFEERIRLKTDELRKSC